ncbi:hypothetical protein CEXT_693431, partial [Caerostris extrusa]
MTARASDVDSWITLWKFPGFRQYIYDRQTKKITLVDLHE